MEQNTNHARRMRSALPWIVMALVLWFAASAIGYQGMTPSQYAAMNDGYMKMPGWLFATLFAVLSAGCVLLTAWFARNFGIQDLRKERSQYIPLYVFILAALVLRVLLAMFSGGYESDVACFKAWGWRMLENGPVGFYAEDYFCDYPPGYLYILGLVQWICRTLELPSSAAAATLLYKMPAILADLLIGCLLYRRVYRRYGHLNAVFAACMVLFSPGIWVDSAVWGQVEAVQMVFLLLTVFAFEDGRFAQGCLWYALAVAVKPQALMLGPVLLVFAIDFIRRNKRAALRPILCGAALALGAFAVLFTPFCIGQGMGVLLDKYVGTMTSYPYVTLNALNLYQFLGLNAQTLDSVALGMTYRTWTWIGVGVSVALAVWTYWKNREDHPLLISSVMLLWALYMFGPAMHERYIYPVAVLLVALAWQKKNRRYLWLACAVNLVLFAAMAGVLRVMHFTKGYPLAVAFTVVNLAAFAAFCVQALGAQRMGAQESAQVPVRALPHPGRYAARLGRSIVAYVQKSAVTPRTPHRLDWKLRDSVLVTLLTLAYAAVGLTNLGDRVWPQTWWEPQTWGESYVYDFEQVRDVAYFNICEGIGDGSLQFEYSQDGENWTAFSERWETSYADYFAWVRVNESFRARYVRLSVMRVGCRIYEIGFFDETDALIPVTASYIGGDEELDFTRTIDEQDCVPQRPNYKNSTYFDEVYHARTAYEQTQGWSIYEQTHPPLGKDIMMLGIKLFGMTPFGWRIMGAVAGVLMLPVMYVFGKYMFGKTGWAAMLTALMGLDFMHYAQTRIATIDSFAVLFILLAYLFMYAYLQQDFFAEKQRRAFWMLALSGVFFGAASAAKWIGVYAGAGLAVIFFAALAANWGRYRAVCRMPEDVLAGLSQTQKARCDRIKALFWRNCIRTILWCGVFFVIVPGVIYCLSYLPYVGAEGQPEGLLRIVWENQKYIFRYHSEYVLEMQDSPHPYQSAWYTWPFIGRPIFFYMGENLPQGITEGISSFGNPAIWWFSVFAVCWVAAAFLRGNREGLPGMPVPARGRTRLFILIALAAQYLPWVFVPRSTYIYHYFATTPFLMMCIVAFFCDVYQNAYPRRRSWMYAAGYVALCLALFVFFYPLLTGIPISTTYAALCRWLPGWVLYAYWL